MYRVICRSYSAFVFTYLPSSIVSRCIHVRAGAPSPLLLTEEHLHEVGPPHFTYPLSHWWAAKLPAAPLYQKHQVNERPPTCSSTVL
jgi:hypothetical protein